MRKAIYLLGRGLQLLGMWLLIVDIFTAGPLGPEFRLFVIGIVVFTTGWAITRVYRPDA